MQVRTHKTGRYELALQVVIYTQLRIFHFFFARDAIKVSWL